MIQSLHVLCLILMLRNVSWKLILFVCMDKTPLTFNSLALNSTQGNEKEKDIEKLDFLNP